MLTETDIQALKKALQDAQTRQAAGACPSCGHCPSCGRGGHHFAPWYPSYPYCPGPYYGNPTITFTSGGAPVTSGIVSMGNVTNAAGASASWTKDFS